MYYEDAINKMRTPLVARLAMLERTCVLVLRKCSAAVPQFECNSFDHFGQIPKRSSVPPVRIWSIVERGSKFYSPFGRHPASTSTPIRARWDGHALENNTDDDDGLTLYMYELCKRLSLTSRLELEG
jgi:hypothetical protein